VKVLVGRSRCDVRWSGRAELLLGQAARQRSPADMRTRQRGVPTLELRRTMFSTFKVQPRSLAPVSLSGFTRVFLAPAHDAG